MQNKKGKTRTIYKETRTRRQKEEQKMNQKIGTERKVD